MLAIERIKKQITNDDHDLVVTSMLLMKSLRKIFPFHNVIYTTVEKIDHGCSVMCCEKDYKNYTIILPRGTVIKFPAKVKRVIYY